MPRAARFGRVAPAVAFAIAVHGGCAAVRAAEPVSFRSAVAPVLVDNCLACHGPTKAEGGYRVDTFEQLQIAGDSGEPPLGTGGTAGGELLRRITAEDPAERMPPDAPPLPPAAIAAVRDWLAAGAAFDGGSRAERLQFVVPPRMSAAPATYPHPVPVTAVAFSPDGGLLLAGGYHELLVFDAAEGRLVRRIANLGQRIMAIRWLADGRTVAVAGGEPGRDGDVRLVDFATGAVKSVVARSADVVCDVALRPGTDQLATASADGVVRIVDAASGAVLRAIASHGDWVTAVAWSDDGGRLASASRDRSAKVYDAGSGDLIGGFMGHSAAVRGLAFTADGGQVLSTGCDGKLLRWDVETGKPVGAALALGGDGYQPVRAAGLLVVPSADRNVRTIDLAKNAVVRTLAHPDWPLCVAVDAAGGRIATGAIDGQVRLWSLADGALVKSWPASP